MQTLRKPTWNVWWRALQCVFIYTHFVSTVTVHILLSIIWSEGPPPVWDPLVHKNHYLYLSCFPLSFLCSFVWVVNIWFNQYQYSIDTSLSIKLNDLLKWNISKAFHISHIPHISHISHIFHISHIPHISHISPYFSPSKISLPISLHYRRDWVLTTGKPDKIWIIQCVHAKSERNMICTYSKVYLVKFAYL